MVLDTSIIPSNPHEAILVDIFSRASEVVGSNPTFAEILRVYDQVLKETGIQDNGELYKILLQCSLRNEGTWIERLSSVLVRSGDPFLLQYTFYISLYLICFILGHTNGSLQRRLLCTF